MKPKISPQCKGMPTTLRILASKYKVIQSPNLTHSDDQDLVHGYCALTQKEIYINSTSKANLAEVLLHEILHAIWYEQGLKDFSKLNEEQTVNNIGIGLTLVMQDNKMLREYLNKQWSRK